VVYQGRVLVSVIALLPACLVRLTEAEIQALSDDAEKVLQTFFLRIMERSGLIKRGKFIDRTEFKKRGFLGSGGIAKFRNRLWAAIAHDVATRSEERVEKEAEKVRARVLRKLNTAR